MLSYKRKYKRLTNQLKVVIVSESQHAEQKQYVKCRVWLSKGTILKETKLNCSLPVNSDGSILESTDSR